MIEHLIALAPIASHPCCRATFGQGTAVQRRIIRHRGAFVGEPAGASGVDVN
jgi:hypothetical protein